MNMQMFFHCEQMTKVVNDFCYNTNWKTDNIDFSVLNIKPTYWDLRKVFERLISDIYKLENRKEMLSFIIKEVFTSKVGKAIFDFENCLYWQPRACMYDYYRRNDFFYDMI